MRRPLVILVDADLRVLQSSNVRPRYSARALEEPSLARWPATGTISECRPPSRSRSRYACLESFAAGAEPFASLSDRTGVVRPSSFLWFKRGCSDRFSGEPPTPLTAVALSYDPHVALVGLPHAPVFYCTVGIAKVPARRWWRSRSTLGSPYP